MQLLKPTNFQSMNGLLKDTLIIILVALSLMPSLDVSSVNSILKIQSAKIQSLFKVRQKLSVWQSMLSKTNFGLEYFLQVVYINPGVMHTCVKGTELPRIGSHCIAQTLESF